MRRNFYGFAMPALPGVLFIALVPARLPAIGEGTP
jgi:hypothetical protein